MRNFIAIFTCSEGSIKRRVQAPTLAAAKKVAFKYAEETRQRWYPDKKEKWNIIIEELTPKKQAAINARFEAALAAYEKARHELGTIESLHLATVRDYALIPA